MGERCSGEGYVQPSVSMYVYTAMSILNIQLAILRTAIPTPHHDQVSTAANPALASLPSAY